jgi:excisionase family DNA binding protein
MDEAARVLQVSRPTLRKWLRTGKVPGLVSHYGTPRLKREVFEKWAFSKDHGNSGKS